MPIGAETMIPVSRYVRSRAAEEGRGTFTYVGSVHEVQRRMGELFDKLESPVLHDVEIVWDDVTVETWPAELGQLAQIAVDESPAVHVEIGTFCGVVQAAMKAIGVRELGAYLSGELNLQDAIAAAQTQTRRYVKRQLTWFRGQMAHWPALDPEIAVDALARQLAD